MYVQRFLLIVTVRYLKMCLTPGRVLNCLVDTLDIIDGLAADFWPVESEGAVFDGPGVDAFG